MSINEAPPASPTQNPSSNNSCNRSKPKFKCSIRSMVSNFCAKRSISKQKPFDIDQKNDHIAASSEATTSKSDDRGGALSLSLVHRDLLLLDSAFEDAKNYMDHVNLQIKQLHEKLEELQIRGSSEGDLAQLWKAIAKLKMKIPSHIKMKIPSQIKMKIPHHKRWPNINNIGDEMMHFFYKEPSTGHTTDSDAILMEEFHGLSITLRSCLLCFFKFPPMAIIKRRVMIYLWIGLGYTFPCSKGEPEENVGNEILDELIAKGFVEPVYQKCIWVPDSCRMSLSVRSSLSHEAEVSGFASNNTLDPDSGFVGGCLHEHSCLINVGEAIIDGRPEIFENMKHVQSLYLGRWQSSAEHHIEMADAKILHGLKKLNRLKFLSLQGISLIMALPSSISELIELKILDLRSCHNLEMIPDNIGFLKNLTHLDMSECYLTHMPESLAQLSNLEVLKGFFIGHYDRNNRSCSLNDLTRLPKLRKLNIYTSVNKFPTIRDLESFEKFERLQKLTISWGRCSLQNECIACIEDYSDRDQPRRLYAQAIRAAFLFQEAVRLPTLTFPSGLQKLELQGFPKTIPRHWLGPAKLNGLKKLYIRGGKICDLGQFGEIQRNKQWTVEILKLKYMSELKIDWTEVQILFPKLKYLHQVKCPKLTNFPCDESGMWMNKEAIDTDRVQLPQQFTSSTGISSSSNLGIAPTVAQDDCKVSPIYEKKL